MEKENKQNLENVWDYFQPYNHIFIHVLLVICNNKPQYKTIKRQNYGYFYPKSNAMQFVHFLCHTTHTQPWSSCFREATKLLKNCYKNKREKKEKGIQNENPIQDINRLQHVS